MITFDVTVAANDQRKKAQKSNKAASDSVFIVLPSNFDRLPHNESEITVDKRAEEFQMIRLQ